MLSFPHTEIKWTSHVTSLRGSTSYDFCSFECSNLPISESSLFRDFDGENDSSGKPTPNTPRDTQPSHTPGKEIPVGGQKLLTVDEEQQMLTKLMLHTRYDVMEQFSGVFSDLVAIDHKYSSLAKLCPPKDVGGNPTAKELDRPALSVNAKPSSLESLHSFTISELHSHIESVREYLKELDGKYAGVAHAVQARVEQLECQNKELIAEVERLRKFY